MSTRGRISDRVAITCSCSLGFDTAEFETAENDPSYAKNRRDVSEQPLQAMDPEGRKIPS